MPHAHELDRPIENNDFIDARAQLPVHRFGPFHRETLPRQAKSRSALVAADLAGVEPIAFVCRDVCGDLANEKSTVGSAYTYAATASGVEIREGTEGAGMIAEIGELDFSDFVNEIHTASGLASAGKLEFLRGGLDRLQRWEPALRSLYAGRPIWTAQAAETLRDDSGAALDLGLSFTLEDSDEDLRAFLSTAGFVHIRGVFDESQTRELGVEIDRVRDALEPGQGDCWWSTTQTGEQVVSRINYLDRWSETIKKMAWDPRTQRLGRLLGDHFRVCDDRLDGPMCFLKNSNIAQGLGDLGWHKDDGLGGHPVMCPFLQVGIQLDRADPENGQLWVLAGSHRYSNHPMSWGDEEGQPVVRIETEPGDVTVHNGDLFHTTPPPTGDDAGRRVLYYKFAEPKTFEAIPAGAHYNDLLFKPRADGRVAVRAATWGEGDTQESIVVVGDEPSESDER
ncbi:MAG: hypothetical protein CL933_11745 [Deltaproteobacteria bacterium]|nr:hypothetical protein [Deltaproteobacteria bacterium]